MLPCLKIVPHDLNCAHAYINLELGPFPIIIYIAATDMYIIKFEAHTELIL